jgi:plasmid replication initiation protein
MRSALDMARELEARAKAKQAEKALNPETPATPVNDQADDEVLDATETPVRRRGAPKGPRGLMPVHHPNRDFFLCDLFDYALKDDGVSMEAPIFSLATKPDKTIWHWESKDGNRAITVTPSVLGRATQFDKDLLIYVVSQMTEALNRDRPDAQSRTVRFRVYDYLVSTNKLTGGTEYKRLQDGLERLRGTSIKTNIKTGGQRVKEGFGIVDSWKIIEKSPDDESMIAVEISLSKWLFNAVQAHEVLTINPDYFRLRRPIERRLYELARKHCGDQARFVIGLELLQDKCGSQSTLKEFRRSLRELILADTLPDYRMMLDDEKDQVVFYTRDPKKLALGLARKTA